MDVYQHSRKLGKACKQKLCEILDYVLVVGLDLFCAWAVGGAGLGGGAGRGVEDGGQSFGISIQE